MLLGKELTRFVKRLVTHNKNIQGHIIQGTSLHGMNIHMLQHTGQQQTARAEECACITHFSWPTNHCLRNKLFDWCQQRWNTKSITSTHGLLDPLPLSPPSPRRQRWPRCPVLPSLERAPKLHGTKLLRASSRKHPSKDYTWWVLLTPGAPAPTGSSGVVGLGHEKPSDVKPNS